MKSFTRENYSREQKLPSLTLLTEEYKFSEFFQLDWESRVTIDTKKVELNNIRFISQVLNTRPLLKNELLFPRKGSIAAGAFTQQEMYQKCDRWMPRRH